MLGAFGQARGCHGDGVRMALGCSMPCNTQGSCCIVHSLRSAGLKMSGKASCTKGLMLTDPGDIGQGHGYVASFHRVRE